MSYINVVSENDIRKSSVNNNNQSSISTHCKSKSIGSNSNGTELKMQNMTKDITNKSCTQNKNSKGIMRNCYASNKPTGVRINNVSSQLNDFQSLVSKLKDFMITPTDSCNLENKISQINETSINFDGGNKSNKCSTKMQMEECQTDSSNANINSLNSQSQHQNQIYKINCRIPQKENYSESFIKFKRNESNLNETTLANSNSIVKTERQSIKTIKAENFTHFLESFNKTKTEAEQSHENNLSQLKSKLRLLEMKANDQNNQENL